MKHIAFLIVLIISLLCISCQPEEKKETKADVAQAVKIAIISSRDILTRCDAGVKIISDIQSRFSSRRIQLGLLEQDVRKLQEDVKDVSVKGPKSTLLQDKLQAYAEEEHKFRQDVAQEESVQFKPILESVNKILDEYAKEKNISAIQERGAFVYFNRSLDITDEVIKRVNQAK